MAISCWTSAYVAVSRTLMFNLSTQTVATAKLSLMEMRTMEMGQKSPNNEPIIGVRQKAPWNSMSTSAQLEGGEQFLRAPIATLRCKRGIPRMSKKKMLQGKKLSN